MACDSLLFKKLKYLHFNRFLESLPPKKALTGVQSVYLQWLVITVDKIFMCFSISSNYTKV
jgi:hypothetical protein